MKLAIAIIASKIVLSWTTPGPGTYYVFRGPPEHARIVAAGFEPNACHVALTVPKDAESSLYWLSFWPGYTWGN